jgi:diguanylate cyclase (GGDEF)-like protein
VLAAPFAKDETGRLIALQELRLATGAPDERFDRVVQLAARLSDAPIAIMSVVAERQVFFKSVVGTKHAGVDLGQPHRDFWFCSHVVATGQPVVVENTRHDPRFEALLPVTSDPGLISYAGVPVRAPGGQIIGALAVFDVRQRVFHESEVGALAELAKLIEAEISPLPYVTNDALTGVLNARSFERIGNRLLEFGDRRGLSSVVLRADIAGLGLINRTYGFHAGDELLVEAVGLLDQAVRGSDLLGRIESDEFALLLVGADAGAAKVVLDRIVAQTLEHNQQSNRPYSLAFHLGGAVHQTGEAAQVAGLLVTAAPQRDRASPTAHA